MLLIFGLGIGAVFIVMIINGIDNDKKNRQELQKSGYNDANALIILKYLGGIKTISAKNNVQVRLLKEGICFIYGGNQKKIIDYSDISDVYIDTQISIQEKVSMGKLLCFGVLAFAMSGKQVNSSKEYIVLEINEDNRYDIILDCKNIQNGLDAIFRLKEEYKNKIF